MKLRYLFSTLSAFLLLLAGCQQEPIGSLENLQLSTTYLTLPKEGGEAELTLHAAGDWAFEANDSENNEVWPRVLAYQKGADNKNIEGEDGKYLIDESKTEPSWLTLKSGPMEGPAGDYTLVFSAEATEDGRELELQIISGNFSQFFRVRQGDMTVSEATVAEINEGPNGKTYQVTGTCESIAKYDYGNWYLVDEAGDKLYIYGTLDAEGKTKNFESLGIEPGDVVKVEGPKDTYNGTVELVNVTVLDIKKSLVKLVTVPEADKLVKDGGEFQVKLAYKGDGVMPTVSEKYRSWISVVDIKRIAGEVTKLEQNPADTAVVTFVLQANEDMAREGSIIFTSAKGEDSSSVPFNFTQLGGVVVATAAEINAAEDGAAVYRLTGYVSRVTSAKYGNIYIKDHSGEVYVYGTYDEAGNRFDAFTTPVKAGDIITVESAKTSYKGSPQLQNAKVIDHKPVADKTVKEFLGAAESKDVYYRLTGTVKNLKDSDLYGNFDLEDATGSVYVYGLVSGWGGPKKEFQKLGVKNGDKVTLVGYHTSYNGAKQVGGAFYVSHKAASSEGDAGDSGNTGEGEVTPSADKTRTNAEILAALTSSETSNVTYDIQSASGVWNVNASQNKANTFLQCRGKKGGYIKTPAFDKDIKSVTIHFSSAKSVYANNVYCVFPSTWTAPTADAAYPEDGNVGKAVTDGTSSLTIPVAAGNKQVYISIIGTYSYYLDHIDVEF